jgi:chemotaxis protein methyltransferase CheR
MHPEDFRHFAEILRTRLGIIISVDKQYLVESRLKPIAASAGVGSVAELLARLRRDGSPKLLSTALDAMTTNETFFFRDGTPFEQFAQLLPDLVRRRAGMPIRIWSAACSTGQEPYSLAMLLEEEAERLPGLKFEITATDVSLRVLEKAKLGIYSTFEVQRGLSLARLGRHFHPDPAGYRINPVLQRNIQWRENNLLNGFKDLGLFDVIFCRNVLIYFAREVRGQVLERLADQLRDGGRLFLGSAETPLGLTERLAMAGPANGGGFAVAGRSGPTLPRTAGLTG